MKKTLASEKDFSIKYNKKLLEFVYSKLSDKEISLLVNCHEETIRYYRHALEVKTKSVLFRRTQKLNQWAKKYEYCISCKRTSAPHIQSGLCKNCFDREYYRQYAVLPKKFWDQLKEFYKNRCGYCGIENQKLEKDHIIPIKTNGLNAKNNIIPCCRKCNQDKHQKNLGEWIGIPHINTVYKARYEEITELCFQIVKSLPKNITRILAIARGGLIPGVIISNLLNIKEILTAKVDSYDGSVKKEKINFNIPNIRDSGNLLIIDDIYDSGETIKIFRKKFPRAKIGVVYSKVKKCEVNYIGKIIPLDNWIHMEFEIPKLKTYEAESSKSIDGYLIQ